MKKRGVVSKMMTIVTALILFGLILLLGVKFMFNIQNNSQTAAQAKFMSELQSDISSIRTKDAVRVNEYNLPDDIQKVCFVDPRVRLSYLDDYPIIKNSVEDNSDENLFFIRKKSVDGMHINGFSVYVFPYFACIPVEHNTLRIKLMGKGNKGYLIPPPSEDLCNTAQDLNECSWLVVFYQDYTIDCCTEYGKCC